MQGTRVGAWLLGAELGRGTMGVVYRATATDGRAEGTAAVKMLTHPSTRDAAFLARFPGEMLGLHRLTHPNFARYFESGVQAGQAWLAMELVEGTDCATLLKQREKTPGEPGLSWRDEVLSIAAQAGRAIKHAHHRSLLHRDLKPANLILMPNGHLKITDCGLAKLFAIPPLTLPGDPMGTAGFLAPEYFTGKPLTRKSDLYALGGVLYTLVAGRPPFPPGTAAELMHKHCYVLPDRPARFVPKLPPEVDELICSLLVKDPGRRPATAAAFLEDLDRVRAKLERKGERIAMPPAPADPTGTHAPLASESSAADAATNRGHYVRLGIWTFLLLLVVGLILFAFFRPRPSAAELWADAQPLLASENPADWDKAWDDALEPLARWHPTELIDEVKRAKQEILDRKELARNLEQGSKVSFDSEAKRLYVRGLRLAQAGDLAAARRTWAAVRTAFARRPAEATWVRLATRGEEYLAHRPQTGAGATDPARALEEAEAILREAGKLRAEGHAAEADGMLEAILAMYSDVPAVRDAVTRNAERGMRNEKPKPDPDRD